MSLIFTCSFSVTEEPKISEATVVLAETAKENTEPKKDALAEAMEAVGGDLLGDVIDDAKADNDATDADMDGASALAALASAAVAADESKKPSNGIPSAINSSKSGLTDVDQHGVTAEERRRDVNWFDVGIIKGTSCTVSSYYLPNGDQEKTDIDVEREDILKKLDLQVNYNLQVALMLAI